MYFDRVFRVSFNRSLNPVSALMNDIRESARVVWPAILLFLLILLLLAPGPKKPDRDARSSVAAVTPASSTSLPENQLTPEIDDLIPEPASLSEVGSADPSLVDEQTPGS